MAKRRTLHIFSENGRSIPVCTRERDGNIAVFESSEPIPVGVHVEWLDTALPAAVHQSNLLEIRVGFKA